MDEITRLWNRVCKDCTRDEIKTEVCYNIEAEYLSSDSPAKIIEVANKLDEFHVKRWNSGGGLSMHE